MRGGYTGRQVNNKEGWGGIGKKIRKARTKDNYKRILSHTTRVSPPLQTVEEVAQHVDRGYRMDAPDACPDQVYSIMRECWKKDPSQRPNFTRIEKLLEHIRS